MQKTIDNKTSIRSKRVVIRRILKWSALLLLLLLIIIPAINFNITPNASAATIGRLISIGHRGAAALAPENTLAAIDSGIAHHAHWVEIDIRQTRDSQIVIMHDGSINRTTTGKGKIHELTYQQLNQYTANKSWAPLYDSVRVPLLKEVLARIMQTPVKLLIEIKNPEQYPGMLERLVKIVREQKAEQQVLIFSFHRAAIVKIQRLLPGVATGIFCTGLENINNFPAVDYIAPHWMSFLYQPSIGRRIHKKGSKVLVWTVDKKQLIKYLAAHEIDGIISNHPEFLDSTGNQFVN